MVERGDQVDVLGEQHPVAEHVPGHVPHAHHGERLGLGVHAELEEVALHGLPRTAGGDAHGLVVVAHGAAGRERVPEPEAAVQGDRVRGVGERRRALVSSDHQVGVVAVAAHHVLGVHHGVPGLAGGLGRLARTALGTRGGIPAGRRRRTLPGLVRPVLRGDLLAGTGLRLAHDVVGDVQQGRDEQLVRLPPLGQPALTVRGGVGELLGEEPALRTRGHDHRVLDHLRLDQAQHLGAEVLTAVGPAQTTAGHLAEAQVRALHARGPHPDLERGARLRCRGDGRGVQLERHGGAVLEHVGAQGGRDHVRERPEQPIRVQAGNALQHLGQPLEGALARLAAGGVVVREAGRVEARGEQLGELVRGLRVVHQGVRDELERVGVVQLQQVAHVGAHHGHGAPAHALGEHQAVHAVGLGAVGEHRAQGVLDEVLRLGVLGALGVHALGQLHAEVVELELAAVRGGDRVGALVQHAQAHVVQQGQQLGEGQGLREVDVQPDLSVLGLRHTDLGGQVRVAAPQLLAALEVLDGLLDLVVLAVRARERVRPHGAQRTGLLVLELVADRAAQGLGPRAHRRAQTGLEVLVVEVPHLARVGQPDAEEQAGQGGGGQAHLEVDGLGVEDLEQLGLDALTHRGVVAVPGQEHHGGHEPPEGVLAQEQAGLAALVEPQHAAGRLVELLRGHVEQLVPRVVLDDPHEVTGGVRVREEAEALDHALHLLPHERRLLRGHGVGVTGEQTQDQVLPVHVPVLGERAHTDVVQVLAAVDRGAAVRLGHEHHLVVAGVRAAQTRELLRVALGPLLPQEPQARVRAGVQHGVLAVRLEVVALDAHEHEVAVPQPLQEVLGGADVRKPGAVLEREVLEGREGVCDHPGLLVHGLLVLGHPAHVRHQRLDVTGQLTAFHLVQGAVQLHADPRLHRGGRVTAPGCRPGQLVRDGDGRGVTGGHRGDVGDLVQGRELVGAGVAHGQQQRVQHQLGATPVGGDLRGQRGHQERHVGGDHVEHGDPVVLADVDAQLVGAAGEAHLPVGLGPLGEHRFLGAHQVRVRRGAVVLVDPCLRSAPSRSLPHRGDGLGGGLRRGHYCITP